MMLAGLEEGMLARRGKKWWESIPVEKRPHDDLGPQLNFTIWILTGLASGFLALRVYCKFWRGRGLWWDDHVLIVSWLCLTASCIMFTLSTTYGFGKHEWDLEPEGQYKLPLASDTAGFLSILAALWSKTSFAMTVLRISSGRWTRISIWFIIITLNMSLGAAALFQYVTCTPIEKSWMPWIKGKCLPTRITVAFFIFNCCYSGFMDLVLAAIPWKIIGGMMMNKKEKFGVLVCMSMGVFAGAASFIKATKVGSLTARDASQATIELVMWGTAEGAITIIAASIPVLRTLVQDPSSPSNITPSKIQLPTIKETDLEANPPPKRISFRPLSLRL